MENTTKKQDIFSLPGNFTPLSTREYLALHNVKFDETDASNIYLSANRPFETIVTEVFSCQDTNFIQEPVNAMVEMANLDEKFYSSICKRIVMYFNSRVTNFEEWKFKYIQHAGLQLQVSVESPVEAVSRWADINNNDLFRWIFSPLLAAPSSSSKEVLLIRALDNMTRYFYSRGFQQNDMFELFHERVSLIEDSCPGIVRTWLSRLPEYTTKPRKNSQENPWEDSMSIRKGLMDTFNLGLMRGCHAQLAQWLDPSRFGTQKSVDTLFESVLACVYKQNHADFDDVHIALRTFSRALATCPAARDYIEKQSGSNREHRVYSSHRPYWNVFPSQEILFGAKVIGSQHDHELDQEGDRFDDRLPMNVLGRLMGAGTSSPSKANFVYRMADNDAGREKIIDVMMAHPAFMAYGFALFGVDLLEWKQASKLDGFRDRYGYGAARYALSTCPPTVSNFDPLLHRLLRKKKELCDTSAPLLENLFVSESSKQKYQALELRKISRKVEKQNKVKRGVALKPRM